MKVDYNNETKKLLNIMKETYRISNNKEEKLRAQQLFILFLKDYAKITNYDLDFYKNELVTMDISEENIKKVLSEISKYLYQKEQIDIVLPSIFNDKNSILTDIELNIRNSELQSLLEKLKEDFNNPNNLLISTWVSNFLSFIEKYEKIIDFGELITYINSIFKIYDKNNEYNLELKSLIENINHLKKGDKSNNDNELSINDIHKAKEEVLDESKYMAINTLLKDYDISIEDGKVLDNSKRTVSKPNLEKKVSTRVKVRLLNHKKANSDELIDSAYKKVGYSSILVNGTVYQRQINDTLEEQYENNEDYSDELMKKGLGKC